MKKVPALKNLWYDIRISPKFLAIVAEEGLVIHDPNFYYHSSGWNMCVRSDIGRSSGAAAFSCPLDPAARASFF
jgi:hypothetical protein